MLSPSEIASELAWREKRSLQRPPVSGWRLFAGLCFLIGYLTICIAAVRAVVRAMK